MRTVGTGETLGAGGTFGTGGNRNIGHSGNLGEQWEQGNTVNRMGETRGALGTLNLLYSSQLG